LKSSSILLIIISKFQKYLRYPSTGV